jgi:phthiocerol/phenolphthiocerol synthesis type-I polyketide synthase C
LGGIGLALADWLVSSGAGAVALAGRSRPSEAALSAIAALRARGARIEAFQADVTDRARLAEVLGQIDREMPPLAGVWHAAG